jgi:hypothetical protein
MLAYCLVSTMCNTSRNLILLLLPFLCVSSYASAYENPFIGIWTVEDKDKQKLK